MSSKRKGYHQLKQNVLLRKKFTIKKYDARRSTISGVKSKEQSIENYLDDDDNMFSHSNAGFEKALGCI